MDIQISKEATVVIHIESFNTRNFNLLRPQLRPLHARIKPIQISSISITFFGKTTRDNAQKKDVQVFKNSLNHITIYLLSITFVHILSFRSETILNGIGGKQRGFNFKRAC